MASSNTVVLNGFKRTEILALNLLNERNVPIQILPAFLLTRGSKFLLTRGSYCVYKIGF